MARKQKMEKIGGEATEEKIGGEATRGVDGGEATRGMLTCYKLKTYRIKS